MRSLQYPILSLSPLLLSISLTRSPPHPSPLTPHPSPLSLALYPLLSLHPCQLKAASDYEERSAVRRALRQLKKEQGRPVGRPQREATYNRFAGTSATATKSVAPKSYIGKEGSSGKASVRGRERERERERERGRGSV